MDQVDKMMNKGHSILLMMTDINTIHSYRIYKEASLFSSSDSAALRMFRAPFLIQATLYEEYQIQQEEAD